MHKVIAMPWCERQLMWLSPNGTLGAPPAAGGYGATLKLNFVHRATPFAVFGASPRLLVRARR